jgi:hypothetical protein
MSLKRRIQKLDGGGRRYAPEQCPGPPNVFIWEGEEDRPVEADAPACPLCGGMHDVHIIEEIVEAGGGRNES